MLITHNCFTSHGHIDFFEWMHAQEQNLQKQHRKLQQHECHHDHQHQELQSQLKIKSGPLVSSFRSSRGQHFGNEIDYDLQQRRAQSNFLSQYGNRRWTTSRRAKINTVDERDTPSTSPCTILETAEIEQEDLQAEQERPEQQPEQQLATKEDDGACVCAVCPDASLVSQSELVESAQEYAPVEQLREDSQPAQEDDDFACICAICLEPNAENVDDEDYFCVQPCGHVMHKSCVAPWFEAGKLTCPCCRGDIDATAIPGDMQLPELLPTADLEWDRTFG